MGRKLNLPYGVDLYWPGQGKVLNVQWDDDGNLDLVSFHRGEWEQESFGVGSGNIHSKSWLSAT